MKLGSIVIDSNDVETLSNFYEKLLGWVKNIQINDGEKWITLIKEDYSEIPLVFQYNPNYKRPIWPANINDQQQMIHLDFYVSSSDFDQKVDHAIKCGAILAQQQYSNDWKVLIDPSGHPFCIIPLPDDVYEQRYSK